MEVGKYHRFFLLNAKGSSCYALFSDNSEEIRRILRYAAYFGTGTQRHPKPELIGHLSRGQTLLYKPANRLCQLPLHLSFDPPSFDVESSNYCGFEFTTKGLKLDSALAAENVVSMAINVLPLTDGSNLQKTKRD